MDRMFRKAAFGGFNKEDVMQYIETMKTEFFDYKSQVEETIRELNEKLASLESADISGTSKTEGFLHSDDPAMSINEAAEHLKRVADEICEKMSRLIGALPQQTPAQPEPQTNEAPASPEEKVELMLQQLFTNKPAAASKQPTEKQPAFSIGDVLPAYLK